LPWAREISAWTHRSASTGNEKESSRTLPGSDP
jgi:hypothetical protein